MQKLGVDAFSDEQVVEVILAYDGLTVSAIPPEDDRRLAARFWRLADRVPIKRLDGLLDTLTAFVRDLLPDHAGIEENDLIDLANALILRRLEAGAVDPLRLWQWLLPYAKQHSYHRDKRTTIKAWIETHDEVRRAIQQHVLLKVDDEPISEKAFEMSLLGFWPTENDIVALLNALNPDDRSDFRWRDILQLIQHDSEAGKAAREAALPFAAGDPQQRDWIDQLSEPRVPEWKVKQDEKARQRAAKRAIQFAEHRRYYLENIDKVRAGVFSFIHGPAQAYLKCYSDLGDNLMSHERVAEWLGEEIAAAAHEGFEAFLCQRPVRPNATRMAISFANSRRWSAGDIIVAALAERLRTRSEPFAGLPDERLMAGLFELWHSRIHDHAGFPDLLDQLEAETRRRGAWEAAVRLYIVPQIKHRRTNVDQLYALMRSDADAEFAAAAASEWLRRCSEIPAEPEAEMIDRLVRSPRRDELRAIGDMRRNQVLTDARRRNWDAVQMLVDFDAARLRLGITVEAELLWHVRARGGSSRWEDDRAPIPMGPRLLAWIVETFRMLWPRKDRPGGVTSGDTNPWDAAEYLFGRISLLGEDTSDEAIVALGALRDAPEDGYTGHLRAVAAEQRRKRAEQEYTPPTVAQIKGILDAGPPMDAADLQAVMLDALETAQKWLHGNDVDWYRGFFRENGDHKDEEPCRDELIKMLRAIDHGIEYIPESHGADDKRVDIVARATAKLILPIEVKGQWHRQLWTAADQQLDHLYVNDWRAERGTYLVLWFGKAVRSAKPPAGVEQPKTPEELRDALVATSKAASEGRVSIVVLDLTRP